MKVTKEKVAEHRSAIVAAAARLFRQRGFEKVSVAEIMKAAGLTHGGFYGHFVSKDALAAEACGAAFADSLTRLPKAGSDDMDAEFEAFLARYLSEKHRDRLQGGCPMAALATEVGHQDPAVQSCFSEGVERYIDTLEEGLSERSNESKSERRQRAIATLAGLVGAMTLARATAKAAPELSAEILAALRDRSDGG